MTPDAYSFCPCGSGKKFKWCCQAFYDRIEKAFQNHANGQHDTALKMMEDLTKQYPDNPEVWGRRAELLWENGHREEAEQAVQKAIEANPNYPFAYFLQGMLRHEEHEIPGALLLYRKAAELCHAEAHEVLGEIYGSIGQCELMQNRPLAARAAWQISLRHLPQSDPAQSGLEQFFGRQGSLTPVVRKDYAFKRLQSSAPDEQSLWEQALAGGQSGKLSDAVKGFEQLTAHRPDDAAAWYNLSLARAWLGDNAGALEALDQYVAREANDDAAAAAWTLAEVLRLGRGMEDVSDFLEYRTHYRIVDSRAFAEFLKKDRRWTNLRAGQVRGTFGGELLDREMPAESGDLAGFQLPRLAALVVVGGDQLSLINTHRDMLEKGRQVIEDALGAGVRLEQEERRCTSIESLVFSLVPLRFPAHMPEEQARRLVCQHLEQFFEGRWIHQPLKSLNQIPPVDAAGHPVLRKKLRGVMQFLEELLGGGETPLYDFDRLRRQLGLPAARAAAGQVAGDFTAMSAAELANVQPDALSEPELEGAFQAAVRLDARELAGRFAREWVNRPPDGADRYPAYQHLLQLALDEAATDEALSWIDAGLKFDCEHNEGRRRNDYELRRAQIHVRSNQPDAAHEVFQRLVERVPSDLNLLGSAAEGMLAVKRPQLAAAFAEQGLAKAKEKGDRDHAGYFEELLASARK